MELLFSVVYPLVTPEGPNRVFNLVPTETTLLQPSWSQRKTKVVMDKEERWIGIGGQ